MGSASAGGRDGRHTEFNFRPAWRSGRHREKDASPYPARLRLPPTFPTVSGGEDGHADRLADPVGQRHRPADVLVALAGIDPKILNPRETWADKAAYDNQARALVDMFRGNFGKFEVHVDADVLAAAPVLKQAAE